MSDTKRCAVGVTRRAFIERGATGLLVGSASLPSIVHAAAYTAFDVGALQVIAVSDGGLVIPTPFLATNAAPQAISSAIAPMGQTGDLIEPPCNVIFVRTPTDVIMIDTGAGPHFMPTAGKLIANLDAAGIDRNTITKVVCTHAHPDHLWGTLDDFDGSPNFPNASYILSTPEWNFWAQDDAAAFLPDNRKFFAAPTKRILTAIKEQVKTITPGQEIAPGLVSVATPGHTVGHIAVEIRSGNEALLIVGDALTHPIISFEHPKWRPAADHHDPEQAIRTRISLLARLAVDGTRIIGFHLPFPGAGRVARSGTGYRYVAESR